MRFLPSPGRCRRSRSQEAFGWTVWQVGKRLAKRKANWKLPEPLYTSGFLAKYARLAQGAETGAITNI